MKSLIILLTGLITTTLAVAVPINTELVVNGGAETGNLTGWQSNGINVVPATGASAGFGSFTFTGGTGSASQTASQTIDVSDNASDIDNGFITSNFSVQLQSRSIPGFSDTAEATISFLDGSNSVLASQLFVDNINTGGFDWNLFTDTRIIPTGTRSINIFLNSTRSGGSSSDGFIDEVSLQLSSSASSSTIPEPSTYLLLLVGLVMLVRTRKQN